MSRSIKNKKALIACALCFSTAAPAEGLSPIVGALGEWKPIIDARLRYEWVDQEPKATLPVTAKATTLRARLGIETGKAWNTALLVEGEFVTPLQSNYRDDGAVATKLIYPVVGDPEAYEVNRAQLTNTSIANTA